jgi:ADP-ribose pyrophosphatase YjhB (NUDIX family)
MNDRLFPATPDSGDHGRGARQGRVLAVRRTRAPLLGHFSLPGCGVEGRHSPPGSREPMEEVGIEAEIVAFNRHVEAAMHEGK